MFGSDSLIGNILRVESLVYVTIALVVLVALGIMGRILGVSIPGVFSKIGRWILSWFSRMIGKKETEYDRDIKIGKITEEKRKAKIYRFMNELVIDLGLAGQGVSPYNLMYTTLVGVFILTVVFCKVVFGTVFTSIMMYPAFVLGTFSIMYTRANIQHDKRIESVIEAENIIANNIKHGAIKSIKDNMHSIPENIRPHFQDCIDKIEDKSYPVDTALLLLNNSLGSMADEFIKNCINYEMNEKAGMVGIFNNMVKINNIKKENRKKLKRGLKSLVNSFLIGATIIMVFFVGLLMVYSSLMTFYTQTFIGNMLLVLIILILIGEFVFITFLRAIEL